MGTFIGWLWRLSQVREEPARQDAEIVLAEAVEDYRRQDRDRIRTAGPRGHDPAVPDGTASRPGW